MSSSGGDSPVASGPLAALGTIGSALLDAGVAVLRTVATILAVLAPYFILLLTLGLVSLAVTALHVPVLESAEFVYRCAVYPTYALYEPVLDAFVELYELLVCWSNSFGLFDRLLSRRVIFGILRECPAEFNVSTQSLVLAIVELLRRYALALGQWLGLGPIANVLPLYTVADALQETAAEYAKALVCLCETLRPLWDYIRRVLTSSHLACAVHQLGNALAGSVQALLGWGFRFLQALPGLVFNGAVTLAALRDAVLLGTGTYAPPSPFPYTERAALGLFATGEFANDVVGSLVCTVVAEVETGGDDPLLSELAFAACMDPSPANCNAWLALDPTANTTDTCGPAPRPVRRLNLFGWAGTLLGTLPRLFGALVQLGTHLGVVAQQFFTLPAGPRFLNANTFSYDAWQIDSVWDTLRRPAGTLPPSRLRADNTALYPLESAPAPDCLDLAGVPRERLSCSDCEVQFQTIQEHLCELAGQLDDLLEPAIQRRLVHPLLCCLPGAVLRGIVAVLKFALDAVRALGAGFDQLFPFLVARSRWTLVVDELIGSVPTLGGLLQCVCAFLDAIDYRLHCVCVLVTHPLKTLGEALRLLWEAVPVTANTVARLTGVGTYDPNEPTLDEVYCLDRGSHCYDVEWRLYRWLRTPRPVGDEFMVLDSRTITNVTVTTEDVVLFPPIVINTTLMYASVSPLDLFLSDTIPAGTWDLQYVDNYTTGGTWPVDLMERIYFDGTDELVYAVPTQIPPDEVWSLLLASITVRPGLTIPIPTISVTETTRETGMPSFAYVPKGTGCREPTVVAAGPAADLKLALVPVGFEDDLANPNLTFADLVQSLEAAAAGDTGYVEIVLVGDTELSTLPPATLRLIQGAKQVDNWHNGFWNAYANLILSPGSPLSFETTTPFLLVNGTLQYALVPTPLLPGGARLALRECGFVECLCRILSVDYLNEFLPAGQQLNAADFPDLCCGLESGLRAVIEIVRLVQEFFFGLLQTFVHVVNAEDADILLRWVACNGSGPDEAGPPAVCSPLPFLLSDLDDFLACPCTVIDTIQIGGQPIPCLCTVLDNVALALSDLVRSALVLAAATTYSIDCADAGFTEPCATIVEDRFVFAFDYIESALVYVREAGGGLGCTLGQLFAEATCLDTRAGHFTCSGTPIDLDLCSGPIPRDDDNLNEYDITPKSCFLSPAQFIYVDANPDDSYVFPYNGFETLSQCGCTPVYRFQRIFENVIDVAALLVRVPLKLLIFFVDGLTSGSGTTTFNFTGPKRIRALLLELFRDITTPFWGRSVTAADAILPPSEESYGILQLLGMLLNCLIGPANCAAPGQLIGVPCVGNFFLVLGDELRGLSTSVVELLATLVSAILGFFSDPEESIQLLISIFTREIPCLLTSLFTSIDEFVSFAVDVFVALVRLVFGDTVANIAEFIVRTVSDSFLWFLNFLGDIVQTLQDLGVGKKRAAQFFDLDPTLRTLVDTEALAAGLTPDDFCGRVLRDYGPRWGTTAVFGSSTLSLEQEGLLRACYAAAAAPLVWNRAVQADPMTFQDGTSGRNPWAGAPTLPADVLTNFSALVSTLVDVVQPLALYQAYRQQLGNLTSVYVDATDFGRTQNASALPSVYHVDSFEELALARGLNPNPGASLGMDWVRFYETNVEQGLLRSDLSMLQALGASYLASDPAPGLRRLLTSFDGFVDGVRRPLQSTLLDWRDAHQAQKRAQLPSASPGPGADSNQSRTLPPPPPSRWTALSTAASHWYETQVATANARSDQVREAVYGYFARYPAGTGHLAHRVGYAARRLPDVVVESLALRETTEVLYTLSQSAKRQAPPCDPFVDDANCTQCALIDEILSETRNIFEFCYQVRILGNDSFITPLNNDSLCIAPQDPTNEYAAWYNTTGLAEGTVLRTVLDYLTELVGCDVLLSPASYLFETNDDPVAGPTGFLFDFLPFYGRCSRDAHLLCQRGQGIETGLVAALLATGGALVLLAFLAPPLASIWNFVLSLLGVTVVFLAVFTNVAWGYSWRCTGSSSGLLTTYILPLNVPGFLLPECAAREFKDFLDRWLPACWAWLAPLVVNGTDPCPTCPDKVQLIDEGCAAYGITGGAAGFGYAFSLVGLEDVIRAVAEALPFLDSLLGLTDALGGPLGGIVVNGTNVTLGNATTEVPPVCEAIGLISAAPYFFGAFATLSITVALGALAVQLVRSAVDVLRGTQEAVQGVDQSDDSDGTPPPVAEDTVPRTLIDGQGRTQPALVGANVAEPRRVVVGSDRRYTDESLPLTHLIGSLVEDGVMSLRRRNRPPRTMDDIRWVDDDDEGSPLNSHTHHD